MWSLLIVITVVVFVVTVTRVSYVLGTTKTENAKVAAVIGLVLCLLPPLALIYLVVLTFKEDASVV